MTLADQIRQYVLAHYIKPARKVGLKSVTIRAGNVHDAMKLQGRQPAVCGALDAVAFLTLANVTLQSRLGPRQGRDAWWVFEV
jgi:5-methylcytosine-specific restriction enzyme B